MQPDITDRYRVTLQGKSRREERKAVGSPTIIYDDVGRYGNRKRRLWSSHRLEPQRKGHSCEKESGGAGSAQRETLLGRAVAPDDWKTAFEATNIQSVYCRSATDPRSTARAFAWEVVKSAGGSFETVKTLRWWRKEPQ